jgi:hypothetical protein
MQQCSFIQVSSLIGLQHAALSIDHTNDVSCKVCSQSSDERSSGFYKLHLRIWFYKYIFLLKNVIVGNVDECIFIPTLHTINTEKSKSFGVLHASVHITPQILRYFNILSLLVLKFKTESDLHLLKFPGIFWPVIV